MSASIETNSRLLPLLPREAPDVRATSKPSCRHCGASLIDERMRTSGFCCSGCSYVFRLVHEHGLAGYYRIKDEITTPADAAVFQPRDYGWLENAQREAEKLDVTSDVAPLTRNDGDAASSGKIKNLTQTRAPELTLDVQG